MKIKMSSKGQRIALSLSAGLTLAAISYAATASFPCVITGMAVDDTNLVFTATVPAGMTQVVLEARPAFDTPWQEERTLAARPAGGEMEIAIAKPGNMAFFRLRCVSQGETPAAVSTDLRFVTMEPLGPTPANARNLAALAKPSPGVAPTVEAPTEAVFSFVGKIDGSDRIVLNHDGALWEHVNWGWPQGTVTINGSEWKPQEKNFLTTPNTSKFLPDTFDLNSATLEVIQGRGVVALERGTNGLIVHMDDLSNGAGDYAFNIHFHPAKPALAPAASAARATLKLSAVVDGGDCFIITRSAATWRHVSRGYPSNVTINGMPWTPREQHVWPNEGTNAFLPPSVDFSTAKIASRKGRDLATVWAEPDQLVVSFADNPNGADFYEIEISFGD
jgi:hypothetical protein